MATVRTWFLETRPSFLLLVPACVIVGLGVAVYDTRHINALHFGLAFLGALLAHIAVNVLNEYSDYRTGIDFKTMKTPFSGGTGILPGGLLDPQKVFLLGIGCLVGVALIGVYFAWEYGWEIVPLGILGIALVYFYTTHMTKDPFLCAIAPGLGFGPLMVLGTYFTQTGEYTLSAAMASMIPGFLVSNLLLLNQLPDVEADQAGDRYHLPIAIGRKRSAQVYAGLILLTYLWLVCSVASKVLPVTALLAVLTFPIALKAIKGALDYYEDTPRLVPSMAQNVMVTLITPLLLGVGVLIGMALPNSWTW